MMIICNKQLNSVVGGYHACKCWHQIAGGVDHYVERLDTADEQNCQRFCCQAVGTDYYTWIEAKKNC